MTQSRKRNVVAWLPSLETYVKPGMSLEVEEWGGEGGGERGEGGGEGEGWEAHVGVRTPRFSNNIFGFTSRH
jgi:hypothetical protein